MTPELRWAAMKASLVFHEVWGTKSQDSVHRPRLLKREQSRSGIKPGSSAYQPNALALGHTGSPAVSPRKRVLNYARMLHTQEEVKQTPAVLNGAAQNKVWKKLDFCLRIVSVNKLHTAWVSVILSIKIDVSDVFYVRSGPYWYK